MFPYSHNYFTQLYQSGQGERQLQNFDCALGMIAWVRIFTALESALTPTACYAASANPWAETATGPCTALLDRTESERYWEARTKMMENCLCLFTISIFVTISYH